MRTSAKWPLAILLAATVTALAQVFTPEEALKQSLAAEQNNEARTLSGNSPDARAIETAQPNATAATFVVNTTADTQDALAGDGICADSTGACSLRAAITEANALPGADVITLPAGTYTQALVAANEDLNAGGDFDLTSPITINGAGSGTTIIEANALPDTATERVIHCVTGATAVVINDVTIRHGNLPTNVSGGGVRLETATTNLTLNRVIVTNNRSAGNGGGISVVTDGIVLAINDSTISANSAGSSVAGSSGRGAGIDVGATATANITNTIVTGNTINSSVSNTFGAGINVSAASSVGATVAITRSTISNNSSTSTFMAGGGLAGGLYNGQATVTITNSSVTGNTASGYHGGVRTLSFTDVAATTITNSTVSNNTSTFGGGGVANIAASTANAITTIIGSTINGNSATDQLSDGGGIENFSFSTGAATTNLTNSTVSGNSAALGGGIYSDGAAATINLNYSTVASNTAATIGGGLYQDFTEGGVTNLKNSIVADNTAGASPDISGTITSQDYNHVESTDGGTFVALANDITGSDPQLGPLANNGGPTATHLPAGTSPVVDTIPNGTSECGTTITVDQRGAGFPRPSGAGCDKGSVEGGATPAAQALNLSTRMRVETGENVGIGGFIITGSAPKEVLLRAIGPSLAGSGVPDPLADPVMELHGPSGFTTIINDNWRDTQAAAIKATGIPPTDDLESAILVTLAPGAYTAIVRGNNNGTGVALVEVYDLDQAAASKLANISTRAFVNTGANIMIAGFILGNGSGNDNLILRGIGPSLGGSGVANPLANPTLELRDGNGTLIRSNNDWQDDPAQAAIISAAGLAPTDPLESGIAATLSPGAYTALLAGLNSGTGVGLVEVYDLGETPQ